MASEALLSERFRIVSRLGEGAFGTVYEAVDVVHDRRVAVKVLHRLGGDAIFRFKQEFRALRELSHPNLVELGELIERGGRYMFSMELVRGGDLLKHVRPRCDNDGLGDAARGLRLDEVRLRNALAQLASGLLRLHQADTVHRDIKPSNVRVTEDGRVVLLDFGLIKHSEEDSGSAATSMVGTAAYMSPEQAASGSVTAASDWYSIGVLLYEALTGRRPFTGSALQVLFDKQRQSPAPPSALVESVPKDLEALCMALLRIDSQRRPSGEEVLRRLGSTKPHERFGAPRAFVGRGAELRSLHGAVDALVGGVAGRHVFVEGESGIGKSRLLGEWVQQVQAIYPQALVLRGGCYEGESVPFRAFDGVVDALSRYLRQLPEVELEPLLPAQAGALPAVFPVLGRVERIGHASCGYAAWADRWVTRNDAFHALRGVFAALSRDRPVILVLDDLQWADTESLQLIERLLLPPRPPALLVVAAGHPRTGCAPAVANLVDHLLCPEGCGMIVLDGLPRDEATHYAAGLLRRELHGWKRASERALAAQLADRSGGHPAFIELLVRHGHEVECPAGEVPTLEQALRHRVSTFAGPERTVLELLAVAGGPLGLSILRDATGLGGSVLSSCVSSLLASALVAEEGVGEDAALVIVQERVRDAVLSGLPADDRARAHRRLADAYLAADAQDAESLAVHLSAAGDLESAVHFAVIAAGAAFDAFSFVRAARLYRLALDLLPASEVRKRRRIWARYADALSGAGQSRDAAAAYLQAMQGAGALEAAELRTRAAQQLMQSGQVREALAHIRSLLRYTGERYPRSVRGARASLLFQRARLRLRGMAFEPRSATWITPEQLHRIDLLWSVSSAMSSSDLVRSADFQTRHLLCALDAGEPYRLARALAREAQLVQSAEPRPHPRVSELFAQARLLAEESESPHAHGVVSMCEGTAAYFTGRFGQALAKLQEAESTLRRRCRGAMWEIAQCQYVAMIVLMYMGRFGELSCRVPGMMADAGQRGDEHLQALLGLSFGYWVPLLAGEPEAARALLAQSAEVWRKARFGNQDILLCIASTYIALASEPFRARAAFERAHARVDYATVERVPSVRVLLTTLHAHASLAEAAHGEPGRAAEGYTEARRLAGALRRENLGYAPAFGALIAAAIASQRGDSMRSVTLLNEAAAGFHAHEMALYAWASRYREGQLVGGQQGREQVARAVTWVAEQGVPRPEALLRIASPGFGDG